jgi:hypothetical protein
MLSDLLAQLQKALTPYSFEDFVRDNNPQNWSELKELERTWFRYKNEFHSHY